ncbi:hypothetical protein AM501_07915 [Aneurinibacillus migulanus]|uniref:Uncharacterized protein n=1 Tax=Aneurinibacillus migulanus TaxID=47500 RepID=A0A0D1X8L3_ANEMI|nr:CBO0543 family protein [Aneurinibacillus migulanus]KIV50786.1 hypothetical protein TS64_26600 [Aneurinibacillus migulanus]KIV55386.1 hypothetical protein TS65_16585 [Aneurinibacillus migulanus]KON99401.1 hypothetical protein AF333_01410 [Aneurinibacillus migulanus]KPD08810.1 hypothetical protein AM501_07915 [Aneurinibacillus migulanus]MCP1358579.1 hypothetical protein [Aneurinibacillus migulanus]
MLGNIFLGFVIPWIFGIWLYNKDKKTVLLIAPLGTMLAYTINLFGFYFGFWNFKPVLKIKLLSSFPFDVGLYPVLSSYLIYFIQKEDIRPYASILIFSLATTLFEYVMLVFGKVSYGQNWNTFWTFWSYVLPYFVIYRYYIALKRLGLY